MQSRNVLENSPLRSISSPKRPGRSSVKNMRENFEKDNGTTGMSIVGMQNQLQEVQRKNEQLAHENQVLWSENNELKKKVTELDGLGVQIKEIIAENSALTAENAKLAKIAKKIEEKADERKNNLRQVYELLEAKERENQLLRTQVAQSDSDASDPEAMQKKMTGRFAGYEAIVAELEAKMQEKDQKIAELEALVNELKASPRKDHVDQNVSNIINEVLTFERFEKSEEMSQDEVIENLLISYANLEQKRNKLAESLGKLQGLSSVKKKELKEVIRAVNEEKKNVLRELRDAILKAEPPKEGKSSDRFGQQPKIEELLNSLRNSDKEKEQLREKITKQEIELNRLKNQLQKSESKHQEALDSLDLGELNQAMAELMEDNRVLRLKLSEFENKETLSQFKSSAAKAKSKQTPFEEDGVSDKVVEKINELLENFDIDESEYANKSPVKRLEMINRIAIEIKAASKEKDILIKQLTQDLKSTVRQSGSEISEEEYSKRIKKLESALVSSQNDNKELAALLANKEYEINTLEQVIEELKAKPETLSPGSAENKQNSRQITELNEIIQTVAQAILEEQYHEDTPQEDLLQSILKKLKQQKASSGALSQHKGEIAALKSKIAQLEQEGNARLKEVQEKSKEAAAATERCQEIQESIEEVKQELAAAVKEKTHQSKELKELRNSIQLYNQEKAGLTQQISELKAKVVSMNEEKNQLENLKETQNDQIEELTHQIKAKEEALQGERNSFGQKLAVSQKELFEMKERIATLEAETTENDQRIEQLVEENTRLKSQMQTIISSQNSSMDGLMAKFTTDIRELEGKVSQKDKEIGEMKAKSKEQVARLENDLREQHSALTRLEEDIEAKERTITQLKNDVAKLNEDKKQLSSKVRSSEDTHSELHSSLEEKIKDLEHANDELIKQNDELVRSNEEREAVITELGARISQLTEEVAALKENNAELEGELEHARDQVNQKDDLVKKHKASESNELQAERAEREKLEKKLAEEKQEKEKLAKKLSEMRGEKEELIEKTSSQVEELAQMSSELTKLSEMLETVTGDRDNLKEQVHKLESEVQQLESELHRGKTEAERSASTIAAQLNTELHALKEANEKLREQLNLTEQDAQNALKNAERLQKELEEKIDAGSQLQMQIDDQLREINALKQNVETLQNRHQEMLQAFSEADNLRVTLHQKTAELFGMEDQNQSLQKQIDSLKILNNNLQEQIKNLQSHQEVSELSHRNSLGQIQNLEKQNQDLESRNQELEKQNHDLEIQNQDLENRNQELGKQNQDLENRIQEVDKQNQELLDKCTELEETSKAQAIALKSAEEKIEALEKEKNEGPVIEHSPMLEEKSPVIHQQLKEMENSLENARRALREKDERIRQLHSELYSNQVSERSPDSRDEEVMRENDELKQKIKNLEQELEDKKHELKVAGEECELLRDEAKAAKQTLKLVQADYEEKVQEVQSLQSKLNSAQSRASVSVIENAEEVSKKIGDLEHQINLLTNERDNMKLRVHDIEVVIDEKNNALDEKVRIMKKQEEKMAELRQEVSMLQNVSENYKHQTQDLQKQLEEANERHKAHIEQSAQEIAQLKKYYDEKVAELETLGKKDKAIKEAVRLQGRIVALEQEVKAKDEEIETLRQEIEGNEQLLHSLTETFKQQVTAFEEEIAGLKAQNQMKTLEENLKTLEENLKSLENSVNSQLDELLKIQATFRKDTVLSPLSPTITSKFEIIKKFLVEITTVEDSPSKINNEEAEQQIAQLAGEVKVLKSSLEEAQQSYAALQEEHKRLDSLVREGIFAILDQEIVKEKVIVMEPEQEGYIETGLQAIESAILSIIAENEKLVNEVTDVNRTSMKRKRESESELKKKDENLQHLQEEFEAELHREKDWLHAASAIHSRLREVHNLILEGLGTWGPKEESNEFDDLSQALEVIQSEDLESIKNGIQDLIHALENERMKPQAQPVGGGGDESARKKLTETTQELKRQISLYEELGKKVSKLEKESLEKDKRLKEQDQRLEELANHQFGKVEDDQIEINYGNFGELEDVKLESDSDDEEKGPFGTFKQEKQLPHLQPHRTESGRLTKSTKLAEGEKIEDRLEALNKELDRLETENSELKKAYEQQKFLNEQLESQIADNLEQIEKMRLEEGLLRQASAKAENTLKQNAVFHEKEHLKRMFKKFLDSCLNNTSDGMDLLKVLLSLFNFTEDEKYEFNENLRNKGKKSAFAKMLIK